MKISEKLENAANTNRTTYSFEYFVPKTVQGVQNLYNRMDRMHALGPEFIDITWNAGGRMSNLTCEMVATAQAVYGLETCMHLTCTRMPQSKVDDALQEAYDAGCQNILALRGDPPRDSESWEAIEGGFRYAKDLVRYIRQKYGDYFDIGVAGYSEGLPDQPDDTLLIQHLKEKVDVGASFVVSQMFYDVEKYLQWVNDCRQAGIKVPLIPGIMPIQSYSAFIRRAEWSQVSIPKHFLETLEPVKDDDVRVRELGTKLLIEMCETLIGHGSRQLHFYTMNLEKATKMILDGLGLTNNEEQVGQPLPWRKSLAKGRNHENVRPIFWKNRNQSYVTRTQEWDEFPNGRWGDSRSPAFGELDSYGVGLRLSNEQALKLWRSPTSLEDLKDLFAQYCSGDLSSLPWSDSAVSTETDSIKQDLITLNRKGFLTINSQPAVNAAHSSDKIYGWGPANGYVYQKAYLELLVPPHVVDALIKKFDQDPNFTYHIVNKDGKLITNTSKEAPNAVTWGVFPGKEIIQPTIVETISFLAWKVILT